ncbi:MAG: hypothetical protein KKG59_06165 [Nanoarchaeota archaeon]|nr:hypothetical protein [Nanoarchaeota archaeon]
MKMRTILLLVLAVVLSTYVLADSGFTVIIVDEGNDCKVLEGYNAEMDMFIPEGWTELVLTAEQCNKAIEELKKEEHDGNFLAYLDLLDCNKESARKSVAHLGMGADQICGAAGYDYKKSKFVVEPQKGTTEQGQKDITDYYSYAWIVLIVLIIILALMIIRKKRLLRF